MAHRDKLWLAGLFLMLAPVIWGALIDKRILLLLAQLACLLLGSTLLLRRRPRPVPRLLLGALLVWAGPAGWLLETMHQSLATFYFGEGPRPPSGLFLSFNVVLVAIGGALLLGSFIGRPEPATAPQGGIRPGEE